MDLTGPFLIQSSQGNNYILVAYHYDANVILVEPLKNPQAKTIVDAWTIINERFKKSGLEPHTYIVDNECSNDLKKAFAKNKITFQRDRPHLHRANAAERAIQTFKNHMKAALASLDPKIPV